MQIELKKIVAWLKLPSTIKGLTLLAGLAGITLTPEHKEGIIAVATMLYGLLAVFYDKG